MKTSEKSIALLFIAASVLSCNKDEFKTAIPGNGSSIISAVIDDDATKTTLDGVKVCWIEGDAIAVNGKKYVATPKTSDASQAIFELTSASPMVPATPPTGSPFRAFYPYDANRTTPSGQFFLPSTQNYSISNPLGLVSPMYAVSDDLSNTFHFKNVCGLLTIDIKGEGTVSDITVSANENLAGTLSDVAVSDDGKLTYGAILEDGNASKSVSLGCGKAATLDKETARRFYIALPEGDFTGVKLTVTTDMGKSEFSATRTVSIKRNNIYHLPVMTVEAAPITFEFALSNLTHNSVTCEVIPSNNSVLYYSEFLSNSEIAQFGGIETAVATMMAYYLEEYTTDEVGMLMDKGTTTFEYPLEPATDYTVFAFAVNSDYKVISAISTKEFKSAEPPYEKASYEDYLGKWLLDGKTIKITEKVAGESYLVSDLAKSTLGNQQAEVEAKYNADKGNMTIPEQLIGTFNHPNYGLCNEYLSGFLPGNESPLPAYPFYTKTPSDILTAWKSKDGSMVWEAGMCREFNLFFVNIGTCWVIQKGLNAGKGNYTTGLTLPQTLKKAPEMEEGYAKWIGTWTVEHPDYDQNDKPITTTDYWSITEGIANQIFEIEGIEGTSMAEYGYTVQTVYDPESKSMIFIAQQLIEWTHSEVGLVKEYLYGGVTVDGGQTGFITETDYPIAALTMIDDNTAVFTPFNITIEQTSYTFSSFGIYQNYQDQYYGLSGGIQLNAPVKRSTGATISKSRVKALKPETDRLFDRSEFEPAVRRKVCPMNDDFKTSK